MPVRYRAYTNRFNRGEIDPLAIARDDVDKLSDSAELVENFMPLRLGPMMYRPGLRFIDDTGITTGLYHIEFIASTLDTAILEFSNQLLRVRIPADPNTGHTLITRTSVTSTISNGTFDTDLTDWIDDDDTGSISSHKIPGVMSLIGDGFGSARRHQTMGATQTGAEHALRLVVLHSPLMLQLGTGASGEEIFSGILKPGTHSLVFTPTSAVTITVSNSNTYESRLDSVELEVTGTFSLPTPVLTASLPSIRHSQSADVVFIAYDSGEQFAVERRGTKSWSIVRYLADDGPFDTINTTDITLTSSQLVGNGTITSSKSYFKASDSGSLVRLTLESQQVTHIVNREGSGTESIQVTGSGFSRSFTVTITDLTGTGSTITLQTSTDNISWSAHQVGFLVNQNLLVADGLDGQITYYRLWCVAGDYSTGSIICDITYTGGSADGIARIVTVVSDTEVTTTILQNFKALVSTRDWARGEWGSEQGYPTAVTLYEGRLWWAGKAKTWGSISDAFYSFDDTIEGDSGLIRRTIGFGPVDNVEWLLPLNRLLMGIASDELSIRSTSLGVVLSPSNANIKPGGSQGAAPIQPVKVNSRGYFVQRSLNKVFELDYTFNQDTHTPIDLTLLNPSICSVGIKRIAVAVQPETRIFVVLNDGSARVYLLDKTENVTAWSRITTDGTFQDVVIVPNQGEDRVYFVVDRTGGTYFEIVTLFTNNVGGAVSGGFDSLISFSSPGTTITGLGHLEGKTVGLWGDGQFRGEFVVSGGEITGVPAGLNTANVGLRYLAKWNSTKLSRFDPRSVLTYRKRVVNTGFILANYWPGSITVGPSASELGSFPLIEDGTLASTTETQITYDQEPFEFFNGTFESDPRIFIQADNPCTILTMTYGVDESNDPTKTPDEG